MHKLISLKLKIAFILLLGALIALGASSIGNDSISILGSAAIIELILLAIGKYSWQLICRLPIKLAWMIDLNGTWKGEIISLWKKNPDDPPLAPIPVTIKIRQNWFDFSVTLSTDKIESISHGEYPVFDPRIGEMSIHYFYETKPRAEFNIENPPQKGCSYMTVRASTPKEMTILYTNDRGLGGDIKLKRSNAKL